MFQLDSKIAFVTGAPPGLGQAIAVALAKNGADVVITDRVTERLDDTENLIQQSGRRVLRVSLDVRDLEQIKSGIATAEKTFGRVDILVNNAGINCPTPGLEVTPENWDDHFSTNVRGGFFSAKPSREE